MAECWCQNYRSPAQTRGRGRLSYRSVPRPTAPGRGLLDAMSSPMHPQAAQTLAAAVDAGWADPRRLYAEARQAAALLDRARETIATDLEVAPSDLGFHLGGGPAALAAGLDGLAWPRRRTGARLVASAVEHSAILIPGRYAAAQASDPDLLAEVPVDALGRVDPHDWAAALAHPGTAVAALQQANGEVGIIQPVAAAYERCREAGVPLLVDGQASLGRLPAPETYDALAGDASAVAGPPLGVLVVPARTRFRRSGPPREAEFGRADAPVWVPMALAAAEAWQQAAAARASDNAEAERLIAHVVAAVQGIPDLDIPALAGERLPHVLTFSALYVDGEAIVTELDRRGLAVASGSACTSSTLGPSHVLAAMGALTHGNVRLRLPWAAAVPDRADAVRRLCAELPDVVRELRERLGVSGL